jgi:hypothetical protein
MKEQIGEVAGKIWQTLGSKGEVNMAQLPKFLKEKSEVTYQALGWLAHEGKVIYLKKGEKNYVALTSNETQIFKTIH